MCYRFYIDLFFKKRIKKEITDKGILVPDGVFTTLSDRERFKAKHEAEYAQQKINELYRDINE